MGLLSMKIPKEPSLSRLLRYRRGQLMELASICLESRLVSPTIDVLTWHSLGYNAKMCISRMALMLVSQL